MSNRRESHRVRVSFDALYSEGRVEGAGQLADLSHTGARIDGASLIPKVGSNMRIYVFVQPVAPFEIVGEVVRHLEGGFALEFKGLGDEARALVDDAAAVVDTHR